MSKKKQTLDKPQNGNDFISNVSSSKRFCTTDLLNAYQAGAVEMYNKIVNSIEKQTLKGLREDSQEWLKIYDKLLITANGKVYTIVHPERCMSLCTVLSVVIFHG